MFKGCLLIAVILIINSSDVLAKKIWPAELLGRDLITPLGKWLGHVGIATANMTNSGGMNQNAYQVIEVLNEPTVGQINSISNFKSRSKYWGSKYGVADRGERGYKVLVEANHQRWWCPRYTLDTQYKIGSGIPNTGQVIECGTWRCDTYVWWAFFSQGYNVMPGSLWLPVELFKFFPFYNDEQLNINTHSFSYKKSLENISTQDLNDMSLEELQILMNVPISNLALSLSEIQLKFANDENLNDDIRGIMIDRLIAESIEPDLPQKLLKLFNETNKIEIKNKIIQALMSYNQTHRNEKKYFHDEKPILNDFFEKMLNSESLTPIMADAGLRGFIDTHSVTEIKANEDNIKNMLTKVNHYSSIMLKYALIFKSKELQSNYMKSLIEELREQNNSDLDSYLFGPLAIAYEHSGQNFLNYEATKMVKDYMKYIKYKYNSNGINSNPKDYHRGITAVSYYELLKLMK